MGGKKVGGVIVDESVVVVVTQTKEDDVVDNITNPSLLPSPSSVSLLLLLRHSNLRLAISCSTHSDLSNTKGGLLTDIARLNSCNLFDSNVLGDNGFVSAWSDIGGSIVLHVVSLSKYQSFHQLLPNAFGSMSMVVVVVGEVHDASLLQNKSGVIFINRVEELPLTISILNKEAVGDTVATVGYIMKPSRVEDFAKRGGLPMSPTPNGLMFLPLTFELPVESQLQHVDIVLHKATDEIISIQLDESLQASKRVTYTAGMEELRRNLEHSTGCIVVDSFEKIYPVLDRLEIQHLLLATEDLNKVGRPIVRGPHFLKVNDFAEPDLAHRLSKAKLSLPSIVKPQVACGVADAHSMAIVFKVEDFKGLSVPLPSVVQEYVDHSSTLFKIYVLGENVFYAVRKSTPNASVLMKVSESNGLKPLLFDSLKSLPTSTDHCGGGDTRKGFDLELVTDAANWLSRKLGLTIFGFDIVVQEGSGDYVIVDVNYLPSFKEVADNVAIPAFWNAIRHKYDSIRRK